MEKNLEEIFNVLGHKIRRNIIKIVGENRGITYSEILEKLNTDTGTLNYHLSKMKSLVLKNNGKYFLSPDGLIAYNILKYAEGLEGKVVAIKTSSSLGTSFKEFFQSFLNLYIKPVMAFSQVKVKLKTYTIISILLSTLFILLSSILYNISTAFLTYIIPLIGIILLVKIIYKLNPKILFFLINYGLTLSPAIIFLLIKLIIVTRYIVFKINIVEVMVINYLLTNILRPLFTIIFLGYLLIAVRESYRLNNSQAFVVVISTLFLSKILFTMLDISEIIYLGI